MSRAPTPEAMRLVNQGQAKLSIFDTRQPDPGAAEDFRSLLEKMGETPAGFAKMLVRLGYGGDGISRKRALEDVEYMVAGKMRISAEMRVIISIFEDGYRPSRKRR
jgi:hypothetical protein